MRHALVFMTLLAGLSVGGLTQEKALITGDVEDQQDKPIANAVLHLRHKELRVDRKTTTDSGGLFFFADVDPADGYIMSAEAPGAKFAPESQKFAVQVGEQLQMLPPFIKVGSASGSLAPTTTGEDNTVGAGGPSGPAIPLPTSFRNNRARLLLTVFEESAQAPAQGPGTNSQSTTGASPPPQNAAPPPQNPPAGPAGTGAKPGKKTRAGASVVRLEYLSTAESSVVTSDQLRSLPFFNRNFLILGLLAPSTHDVPEGSELKDTTFSISGERPTSDDFLLDGLDNVASSSNQAIPFQVNDAIQEFRVVYATPDAQFGRNIGGVVNIVTQRGTAQFHGSVFGYFASDALNATSPLSSYYGTTFNQAAAFAGPLNAAPITLPSDPNATPVFEPTNYNQYVATAQYLNAINGTHNCTVPGTTVATPATCFQRFDPAAILAQHNSHAQPLSSQQFGGQAGGPIGKRWFWFGDYEGTRINNPNPIFERVPSSFDRSHLGEFVGTSGYQDALIAQNVLSLYPVSNVVAVPGVLEFYQGQAPNYTNVNNYLGRLDFNQSGNSNWTVRYNAQQLSQLHDDSLPNSATYPGNGAIRDALNQSLAVSFTHAFSDKLSNVAHLGWTSFRINETPQDQNFNPSSVGLTAFSHMPSFFLSGLDPQYAGAQPGVLGAFGGWDDAVWTTYLPPFYGIMAPSLDGLFPFARIGAPLSAPGQRHDSQLELVDNVSIVHGKHSLRLGVEVRWLRNTFNTGGFSRGLVVSSDIGEFTSDSETCISIPCYGPMPNTNLTAFTNPSFDYALKPPAAYNTNFHSYAIAGYVQDMWRIRPHLTLNLGLRYEYFSPPSPVNGTLFNYAPAANGLVSTNSRQVVDMFGSVCGTGAVDPDFPYPVYPTYSVYADQQFSSPWKCTANGNANFLRSSVANFGPRVGISWSTASGNTVLRAGFGIFYDQVPASNYAQLAFNRPVPYNASSPQAIYGQNFQSTYCEQCGFGNSSLNGVAAANQQFQSASIPFGINAIDPSASSTPMTRQISASAQRQIARNISAEVGYIGNYTQNLPVKSNTGFNNEWFCTSTPGCDNFSYVPVFITANSGYGNYNALVAKLTARGWAGLQLQASYTYSKALDNGSAISPTLIPAPLFTQLYALQLEGLANPALCALGSVAGGPDAQACAKLALLNLAPLTGLLTQGVNTTGASQVLVTPYSVPQEPYNSLQNDYGRSDYDQTNRFILEHTWDIPGRKASALRGGWMLSGVFNAQSGRPFTIFNLVGGELTQRVSLAAPLTMTGNPNAYIGNLAAIVNPALGCKATPVGNSPYVVTSVGLYAGVAGSPCPGTSSRNQFTGPAYVDYDMALQKSFQIAERSTLIFRAESYNLFNRANYHNPISTYSLDGVTQYSQFGQIQSAYNPRQFQFALRMNW